MAASRLLLIILGLLLVLPGQGDAKGPEPDVDLRIRVSNCDDDWLPIAKIELSLFREGEGRVDYRMEFTDPDGYIVFPFKPETLFDGDYVIVAVAPEPGDPWDCHTFHWIADAERNGWELGVREEWGQVCPDEVMSEEPRVFQFRWNKSRTGQKP